MATSSEEPGGRKLTQGQKLATDLGPVVVFFAVNYVAGLMWATAAIMAATVVAIAVGYAIERKVPMLPAITCGLVLVFGGLTLFLQDETFIKMKPTIVKLMMAAALAGSVLVGRNLARALLSSQMHLTEPGWRKLAFAWAGVAVCFAIANEVVWRSVDTDTWVTFKTAVAFGGILVYGVVAHLIARAHWDKDAEARASAGE
jgi:intracellular septation protein